MMIAGSASLALPVLVSAQAFDAPSEEQLYDDEVVSEGIGWQGAEREHVERGRLDPEVAAQMRERWRDASTEERTRMREELRARARDATPRERRRLIRRRRQFLRSLPADERREFRAEDRAFAQEHRSGGRWRGDGASDGENQRLRDDEHPGAEDTWREAPHEGRRSRADRRRLRARLRELPREERQEIMERIRSLRRLGPDRRQELWQRLREVENLPGSEREALEVNRRRWRELAPERREELRDQMRRLRALPPDERLRVLESLDLDRPAGSGDDQAP